MTNAIDRESLTQLKKELEEVLSSVSVTSHQLTLVDVQLMVQVIQEWEHNEDAHLQGTDLVESNHGDFMFRCTECDTVYYSYSTTPARCPDCNELNVAN